MEESGSWVQSPSQPPVPQPQAHPLPHQKEGTHVAGGVWQQKLSSAIVDIS